MSRIDRVLVSNNVLSIFTDMKLIALARGLSDHLRPLLFHNEEVDFGPTPFKFFNSWTKYPDFDNLVNEGLHCGEYLSMNSFHDKLKCLKSKLKEERNYLNMELDCIFKIEDEDNFQKVRIKWDVEGDENSKDKFMAIDDVSNLPDLRPDSLLSSTPCIELEKMVSEEEIKAAIWECGSDKAPGPDGFSFSFIKLYWEDLRTDLVASIRLAFAECRLPKGPVRPLLH
ncbi:uncharacterized protein [Rutidosis leptorrhynchoides]|uniref:uncharacterized protein n=1 Tax=Rutidosis leptorrhynchoides TaxID=125765 RepID=UPI003A9A183B